MRIPKKFEKWPTLYRYGYEDAQDGCPYVGDRFTAGARDAYRAGYEAGSS
jgi:hypothetical protein